MAAALHCAVRRMISSAPPWQRQSRRQRATRPKQRRGGAPDLWCVWGRAVALKSASMYSALSVSTLRMADRAASLATLKLTNLQSTAEVRPLVPAVSCRQTGHGIAAASGGHQQAIAWVARADASGVAIHTASSSPAGAGRCRCARTQLEVVLSHAPANRGAPSMEPASSAQMAATDLKLTPGLRRMM